MPIISTPELTGWKAIAAYLRVSVRTAQSLERDKGLPIHRGPGAKPQVLAIAAELDTWKSGNLSLGKSTTDFYQPVPIWAFAHRYWKPLSLLGILVLIVSMGFYWTLTPHGPPADFRVQDRNLIVLNSRGQELWRHAFPWELREPPYGSQDRARHSWLGRLDGKEPAQLLFNAVSYKAVDVGSPVFCFGPKGNIAWQFVPGRSVVDGSGDSMVPPYLSNTLLVIRGKTDAETRVVISSNHYLGQANQVAFLSSDGHVVGEYWHPGHLLHLRQVALDDSGREKLLLAGVNNGNHQATLVVLDPLKVSGVVTPKQMQDHRFELLNMAASHETAAVFFPRSCISANQPYTRVTGLQINKERIVAWVSEGTSELDQGFVYEFDYHLRVTNVVPMNGVDLERRHRSLEAQGKLDHSFNLEQECARLKAGLEVRRSEE